MSFNYQNHSYKKSLPTPVTPVTSYFQISPVENQFRGQYQSPKFMYQGKHGSYIPGMSNPQFPLAYTFPPQQQQQQIQQDQNMTDARNHPTSLYQNPSINYPVHRLAQNCLIPLDIYNLLMLIYSTVESKRYATSAINPLRNYLTVYEYSINKNSIIWDYETGYVHLTGIWKAAELNNANFDSEFNQFNFKNTKDAKSKADIVKLLDSTPKQYQNFIKRIRGGLLKIQGTWLPYNLCKILARRFCYYIRFELIPIFGNDFPDYCLTPSDEKFGKLVFDEIEIDKSRSYDPGELVEAEIVEASKCLEALSNAKPSKSWLGNNTHDLTAKSEFSDAKLGPPFEYAPRFTMNQSSRHKFRSKSLDDVVPVTPITPITPTTLRMPQYNTDNSPPGYTNYTMINSPNDGISSLLKAADLTQEPPNKTRRVSIKIHDLLT